MPGVARDQTVYVLAQPVRSVPGRAAGISSRDWLFPCHPSLMRRVEQLLDRINRLVHRRKPVSVYATGLVTNGSPSRIDASASSSEQGIRRFPHPLWAIKNASRFTCLHFRVYPGKRTESALVNNRLITKPTQMMLDPGGLHPPEEKGENSVV